MVVLKNSAEIEKLRRANQMVARVLGMLTREAGPGVTTRHLDELAEKQCRSEGAEPAFKGYRGFPFSLCASVNEQVVHGFPNDRPLHEGDILSMDFGVRLDGYYGDSAITIPIGDVPESTRRLMEVTRQSLHDGIAQARPGNRLYDISHAVQKTVEEAGYSVVRKFVGHGIGKEMHEDPQIPNFGKAGEGLRLRAGMTFAIEPMVNAGGHDVEVLDDGWTAVTKDRSLSAHFEHTIAITEKGPVILSTVDGG
ncbi:MAG: type I methionyl aminopeptidase [Desulfatibacillaceae bacterium]